VTDFKIVYKIQDVEELPCRGDLVALTAPLMLDHTVIIGFYRSPEDQGCIEFPEVEFNPIARLLYQPARTKIAVHGLKRIWEELEATGIGASELDLDSVTDTKLMAYLLNPDAGRGEAEGSALHNSLMSI
jgi:hypothetical protein